ncbi:MAG: hypothetical protein E6R09_12925 [Rhodocyclaceae bacterium]|nr:MAG: hypothetical protein E6R09_12925 [Rhodocyclaceae bacterium]
MFQSRSPWCPRNTAYLIPCRETWKPRPCSRSAVSTAL